MPRDDGRQALIEVKDLVVAFHGETVLENLSLEVRRGEILGIVGGSGSGKSVLLKTILRLIKQDAGEVRVFGQELSALNAVDLHCLKRRWGILFQAGALFSSLSVEDNIARVIEEHVRLPRQVTQQIAELKITMVGLDRPVCGRFPGELSGGMRKKAGLARALALDPEIVFLDEPTAGLDPLAAAGFDELIEQLRRTLGLTVVLVTHDLDTVHAICDRVAILAEKRLIATGSLEDVAQRDHPFIHNFFRGPRGRAALDA